MKRVLGTFAASLVLIWGFLLFGGGMLLQNTWGALVLCALVVTVLARLFEGQADRVEELERTGCRAGTGAERQGGAMKKKDDRPHTPAGALPAGGRGYVWLPDDHGAGPPLDHTFEMKEGTLYPVLHGLEREGLVEAYQQEAPHGKDAEVLSSDPAGSRLSEKRGEVLADLFQRHQRGAAVQSGPESGPMTRRGVHGHGALRSAPCDRG